MAWPLGSTEADPTVVVPSMNVTVPVGTADPVTVAVKVTGPPKVEGLEFDARFVVVGGPLMVSFTSAVWVWPPPVPLIVRSELPRGVDALDVIVIVDDPDVVTDGGAKLTVEAAGSPLTLKVTGPVNPPVGATGATATV